MDILRGKHAGRSATLHQIANDWMMVDVADGPSGVIVKPTQVRLDPDERRAIREHVGVGTFWDEWRLNEDDGTFSVVARQR